MGIRSYSDKPQSDQDAKKIEESMHGLYSNWISKKGVSYYYNQSFNNSLDTRVLSDIDFLKFTNDAFVEFHGCRIAEIIPVMNSYFSDNFAKQFSDALPVNCIVVGHITNSNPNLNPNGKGSDYRHGKVRAYQGGSLLHDAVDRRGLKFVNSSTSGQKL